MFTDRTQAGKLLAIEIAPILKHAEVTIIGLSRGGVIVGEAISKHLRIPLDVLVVKKISSPRDPELAIGAITLDNVFLVDYRASSRMGIDERYIRETMVSLGSEIRGKAALYRKGRGPVRLAGKTVILIDDGAATGATIETAIRWIKRKHAKSIIVGLPVAPRELVPKIAPEVTKLIVLETPEEFSAVGAWYTHFPQVTDKEVVAALKKTH